MKSRVLIVEDEVLVAEDIAEYLRSSGYEVNGIATSVRECMDQLKQQQTDVVLLDIRLKGEPDGVDAARMIHNHWQLPVIYLTANNDDKTLQRAIATQPASFISKPFNLQDIKAAIEIACTSHHSSSVFVKDNSGHKRIESSNILYLEADGSYTIIYTKQHGRFTQSTNLQRTAAQLDNNSFMRVHRSFVINKNFVESMDSQSLIIHGKHIPVSRQYKKEVHRAFKKI